MHSLRLETGRFGVLALACLLSATLVLAHDDHGDKTGAEVMLVAAVVPEGPAASAGLAKGDRILAFDGQKISTEDELRAFLRSHRPGETIPLTVEREGETIGLSLTFGEAPGGGVRMGISVGVDAAGGGAAPAASGGFQPEECLAWVSETYRVESLARELSLDVAEDYSRNLTCMDNDTQRMAVPIPRAWCDNGFKVHCSGLDLLAEIGDALVERCEALLSEDLGVDVRRNKAWKTCGEQEVYDRYAMRGETSDLDVCRSVLFDQCGATIEGVGPVDTAPETR